MKLTAWKLSLIHILCLSDKVFLTIVYASVILLTLAVLYPLWFVIIASVSSPELVASGKVLLFPKGVTWEGYRYILSDRRIWTGYYNTIRYTLFGTLIALFLTIPAGYADVYKRQSLEHKLKYKKEIDHSEEIAQELEACAEIISSMDERMQEIRNRIERG